MSHRRNAARRFRRTASTGQAPGTVHVDPTAPIAQLRLIAYGPDGLVEKSLQSATEVQSFLTTHNVVWLDVEGLGGTALVELGRIFQLHPLALEDVVNVHQRAKVESYDDLLFVVGRRICASPLATEQISFFLGARFLITFQEGVQGDCFEPVRQRLRSRRPRLIQGGPDYLFYELFDTLVDSYFPAVEQLGEQLDQLELAVPHDHRGDVIRQLHLIRTDLLQLRRSIWPHRDAIAILQRSVHSGIKEDTLVYLRDCHDHAQQIIEMLDVFREMCSDLREYYYAIVGQRTNDVMRTLTVIATLFMPLSFIAGVYGMNFDHMPELHWWYGYPVALLIMGTVAMSFLAFFHRRGWLRPNDPRQ